MYPLKFENLYFDKVWGARGLEKIRKNLPEGKIGESWDVSCHPHGMSVISNGEFKGMTLQKLIDKSAEKVIGKSISKDRFPLLIKLLNTSDKLSVQVHPNDEYAKEKENELGKTEVWYVVDAEAGAKLIVGTNGCTKEQFRDAIANGNPEEYMNIIEVKKGDTYLIKSGLVHSIGGGLLIAEIQQNSDTTYRVYDYNRGRELHIEKALDVIDFALEGKKSEGLKLEKKGYSKTYLCLNDKFTLELYDINQNMKEKSDLDRFYIFTCVDGEGEIEYKDGAETIRKGESILIPACLGEYSISGNIKVLKSYVPDVEAVRKEILNIVE